MNNILPSSATPVKMTAREKQVSLQESSLPTMRDDLLERNNGANFYLADLHIHTPSDKRFKCPGGVDPSTTTGKEKIAKAYIEAAQKKGIKILGITEHNDVSWIDPIRKAAQGTDVLVFPGIELSADSGSEGIHIIALFEPDEDITTLHDLITELGLPTKNRFHPDGSPRLTNKQLSELVDFISQKNGICIAAHVLGNHGILKSDSKKSGTVLFLRKIVG